MNTLPTVPWSPLPPVTLLGTSLAMFGSESITPNSLAYLASWTSLSRSTTGLQIGSRTFCVPAGSSARTSSGCDCAYASDWLIAVRNLDARSGFFVAQSSSAAYPPIGQNFPSTGPGAIATRSPSRLSPCDRNGSGAQNASIWPLLSAVLIAGNGSARSLTESGFTPSFLSAALIITSPTPLSALTAIVFPARSAGDRIELDPF